MVIGVPVTMQFHGRSHEPTHQIKIVWRLANDYSAALACPGSAPGVGAVVRRFPPTEHGYNREHRLAEFAGVDRFFHSQDWFVPAPLTDHAQLDSGGVGRSDRTVTGGEIDRQRLL